MSRVISTTESLDRVRASVRLNLENPRATAIKIEKIVYQLEAQDVAPPQKGTIASGDLIEAHQVAELEFGVGFPLPDDGDAYKAIVARGEIDAIVSGEVVLADGGHVPFNGTASIPTPLIPKFVIQDAQAALYGEGGIDVTFFLRLMNENPFSVTVSGVEYTVTMGGAEPKAEEVMGMTLVAGSAQEFEVSAVLDEKRDKTIGQLRKNGVIPYRLTGRVHMAKFDVPFEYEGQIQIPES